MLEIVVSPSMKWLLGTTCVLYVVVMYALGFWARGRVHSSEDFIVAGRRLPLSLAWMTLLATWFGAGTLMLAADEARQSGVQGVALDPWGAGICLLLAGLLLAGPLWRMGLLTVADFFRQKFGPAAELISALFLVPSYFGWIAAQFVALAGVLKLYFDIPIEYGMPLVALVGMGYTLLGGMWSVTLTDAVQIVLLLVGLIVLGWLALAGLGGGDVVHGWHRLMTETDADKLAPAPPLAEMPKLLDWLAVLAVGALGNLPGQDLAQRILSSKSARVARRACLLAGVAYLLFGAIPVMLGLIADRLLPEHVQAEIVPALANAFFHPVAATIFTVTLLSAVLSTIDSAILSPASVLSHNVLEKVNPLRLSPLRLNRLAVVFVTAASLGVAYLGENAYGLLEEAYSLMLVGLFVPLMFGIYTRPRSGLPAIASMTTGGLLWLLHLLAGWESFLGSRFTIALWQPNDLWQPNSSIMITLYALLVYVAFDLLDRARRAAEP